MPETDLNNDAALAVLGAVTRWFTEGESDAVFDEVNEQDPSSVVAVLFGCWLASIETVCEVMDCEPIDYLRQVSLQLQRTMVGLPAHFSDLDG